MDQTAAQKQTEIRADQAVSNPGLAKVEMKLEVVIIPVSDVERAKEFYKTLGWRLDLTPPGVVQFTPPGSGVLGPVRRESNISQGLWLIVSDLQTALDKLASAGIEVNEIYHIGVDGKASGLDPERRSYCSSPHSGIRMAIDGSCRRLRGGCPGASIPPYFVRLRK